MPDPPFEHIPTMVSLSELNRLNKQFCAGALHYSTQTRSGDGTFWKANLTQLPDLDPNTAVYRSVFDKTGDRLLFVLDLDYYGVDLEKPLDAAREIQEGFDGQFFCKFSGNRGFHLINLIDRESENWLENKGERKPYGKDFNEYFKHIVYRVSRHTPGTTIDQVKARTQDLVWIDITMYRSNKLIRSLCVNLRENPAEDLYSVPVDLEAERLYSEIGNAEGVNQTRELISQINSASVEKEPSFAGKLAGALPIAIIVLIGVLLLSLFLKKRVSGVDAEKMAESIEDEMGLLPPKKGGDIGRPF